MENGVRADLIEFLSCMGFPSKNLKEDVSLRIGKDLAENDDLARIFNSVVKNYSKEKRCQETELISKGLALRSKLTPDTKIKLVILLFNYYTSAFGELRDEHEVLVRKVAQILDLTDNVINQLLDFFIIDEPFIDRDSAAYLVNSESPVSYRHICVNICRYNEKQITYVKYISEYNTLLSKRFKFVDKEYSLFEQYFPEKVSVYTADNFNWAEFSCIGFEEITESIKRFKPYSFCEVEQTENTPKVVLDPENNKIIISGSSSPLSLTNFFNPVLDWIQAYKIHGKGKLQVYIILDYFNTYTSKFLTRLNKECDNINQKSSKAKIYFYLDPEDDDMREFGEHMHRINKKGFEFCFINESFEMINE